MPSRALLALALVAACDARGAASRQGAPVRIALEAEPSTLNPLVTADGATLRLLGDVYEGLLCPGDGPAAPPHACLAERWSVSPDGRQWRFALRRGVTFHDGSTLTAADVVATFERVRAARSHVAAELDDLIAVAAEGDGNGDGVVLTFARMRPDRTATIARVPIVPRRALGDGPLEESPLGRAPIGTGPLRVVAWRAGESIELVRWAGAWDERAASERVVYVAVADRADALRRLARGELDVVTQVPPDQAARFSAEHPGVRTFRYLLPAYLAAVLDARRPALATPEQRRALAALLDRPSLRREILVDAPAITGPFPPGDPGADATVAEIPFSPAAARGAWPSPPRLTVLVPQGSRAMARIADVWASDARGIAELVVEEVPFAELIARLREGRFDVALTSMTTGPELDLWPRLHSAAPPDEAWPGLRDAELDRVLDAIRAEADPAARAALRRQAHRRIAALVPMVFIAADARVGLAGPDITGLGDGRGGPPPARRLARAARP